MKTELNLSKLAKYFSDEDAARQLLEDMRWGKSGAVCPHCGGTDPYTITPKAGSKTRKGLYKCKACRKQFTVTVGTVMEASHIPISKWLLAIYLLASSKKGFSAHQLHRNLGVTYKAAWFMAHRLRYAMADEAFDQLRGIVEVDETYVGGRRHLRAGEKPSDRKNAKTPVVALVERGGRVRAMPMDRITAETLGSAIREHVHESSVIHTDELPAYRLATEGFAGHETTRHSTREYVRGDVHSNSAEGFFSLLKRGINGTFHHVGKGHLGRYVDEFSFRYNARKTTDSKRTQLLVNGVEGKRLTYKQPVSES